jgi:hypothetical protein
MTRREPLDMLGAVDQLCALSVTPPWVLGACLQYDMSHATRCPGPIEPAVPPCDLSRRGRSGGSLRPCKGAVRAFVGVETACPLRGAPQLARIA